uniref:Uncharacterized protein n=1 Tax=Arundo donax TaxID=35708 RepID=A0A0A8YPS6_ARUDO
MFCLDLGHCLLVAATSPYAIRECQLIHLLKIE